MYVVCSVFSFVLFSTPPGSFFRLNHVRKVWIRCYHSRLSFEAIILRLFDQNVGLCCSSGNRGYFVESSLQTGSPYGFFQDFLSNGPRSKARGQMREGKPAMVLVRFEYLHSDSECKLLIGQFDLTDVK